jgi:hypothetical protein
VKNQKEADDATQEIGRELDKRGDVNTPRKFWKSFLRGVMEECQMRLEAAHEDAAREAAEAERENAALLARDTNEKDFDPAD